MLMFPAAFPHRGSNPQRSVNRCNEMKGPRLPIIYKASANPNVINILCEKLEEWVPCLARKLKYSNRAKDWWIVNKIFTLCHGARSLVMKDISSNQMR